MGKAISSSDKKVNMIEAGGKHYDYTTVSTQAGGHYYGHRAFLPPAIT